MYKVDHFINGKSSSESNKTSKIYNPSYGTEIGEVLCATNEVAAKAVESAYEASKAWSKTGLIYRSELILKFRQNVTPSKDGNTVELHVEQMQFSENVMRYQSSLEFLNRKIAGLMSAIKGE